jgi:stress-induced morphogen
MNDDIKQQVEKLDGVVSAELCDVSSQHSGHNGFNGSKGSHYVWLVRVGQISVVKKINLHKQITKICSKMYENGVHSITVDIVHNGAIANNS